MASKNKNCLRSGGYKFNLSLAEWAEYGTLVGVFKGRKSYGRQLKILLFQIIYTLAVINFSFLVGHNDFHTSNLLVQKVTPGVASYQYRNNNFVLPFSDLCIKFWDYDLSDMDEAKNVSRYERKIHIIPALELRHLNVHSSIYLFCFII